MPQRLDLQKLRVDHARSVLKMRIETYDLLEEARREGRKPEARQYEGMLRQLDKAISDYGLDRYA